MNNPLVSIIVPVYNVGPYIEACIRSVMRQTYDGPMECIIVDDCGTDDSMAIVEKVIEDYNGPITFKILHHTHNRGLSAARNTGMDVATGEYIFFLDSDDELTDDSIEKLVYPLKDEKFDIVVGDLKRINKNADQVPSMFKLKLPDKTLLRNEDVLNAFLNGRQWYVLAQNKLYSNALIKRYKLKFKEGIIHEDVLWSFLVACYAKSLYAVRDITYLYKERNGSITDVLDKKKSADSYRITVKEMGRFVKTNKLFNSIVYQHLQNYLNTVLRMYHDSFPDFEETYKDLRPYTKYGIKNCLKYNGMNIRCNVRDLHYLFPINIAPYWLFYIYFCLNKYKNKCLKLFRIR